MISEGIKQGLEAYIIREDGTRFREHQVVYTDGNDHESSTTSCFLESTEGSIFTIIAKTQGAVIQHPTYDWGIIVSVDGRTIKRCATRRIGQCEVKASGMVSVDDNGNHFRGKLVFAKLRTTDADADVTLHTSELRSVGQISVSFERGIRGKDTGRIHHHAAVQSDVGVASERGKKLGGSISSKSRVPYVEKGTAVKFRLHDKSKPFHRIVFNYRTRPVLELMRIVEVPESVEPVIPAGPSMKGKRTATSEDVKPDHKAMLAASIKELERRLREVATLPRKQVSAEVIDMTGDDSGEE